MSQNQKTPNLSDMISQLLSDPQKMQQFSQMASSLGLGGNSQQTNSPSTPDLSSLLSPNPQNSAPAPDLSLLLQNLASQNIPQERTTSQQNPPALDLSGLLSSLNGNNNTQNSSPTLDFSMIEKIQNAMQMFSQSNPNVDLLRALRPLLSQKRAKKVDDAIRIMQLIQILPMLKESGLFGFGGEQK